MNFKDIEGWLLARISDELGVAPNLISADKNLFALGLTSLQAVELALQIEAFLGYATDPLIVCDYPVIRRLAVKLETICNVKQMHVRAENETDTRRMSKARTRARTCSSLTRTM